MENDRRIQLERRRRRVLRDDAGGSAPSNSTCKPAPSKPSAQVQTYTEAARADRQPRITDLIPQAPSALLILFLCGVTVIVGLETLFAYRTIWFRWLPRTELASLDVTASGSLAGWYSSVVLACAAAYAVLVFNIRRHKLDDYRGRYALWLWATCACLVASIDATAGLHQTIRGAAVALTGTPLLGDGSVWWVGCAVCLFGVVALRVLLDMRECPGACLALGSTTICYLLATIVYSGLVHAVDDVVTAMLRTSLLLLGHLMLLFSFLVYARHVFLDAQGRLVSTAEGAPGRTTRLRRLIFGGSDGRASSAEQAADEGGLADGPSPPSPGGPSFSERGQTGKKGSPTKASPQERAQESSQENETEAGTPPPEEGNGDRGGPSLDDPTLTKAERRRLRKQLRRQRQAA